MPGPGEILVVYRSRILGTAKADEAAEARFQASVDAVGKQFKAKAIFDAGAETTSRIPGVLWHQPRFDATELVRQRYQQAEALAERQN